MSHKFEKRLAGEFTNKRKTGFIIDQFIRNERNKG